MATKKNKRGEHANVMRLADLMRNVIVPSVVPCVIRLIITIFLRNSWSSSLIPAAAPVTAFSLQEYDHRYIRLKVQSGSANLLCSEGGSTTCEWGLICPFASSSNGKKYFNSTMKPNPDQDHHKNLNVFKLEQV